MVKGKGEMKNSKWVGDRGGRGGDGEARMRELEQGRQGTGMEEQDFRDEKGLPERGAQRRQSGWSAG